MDKYEVSKYVARKVKNCTKSDVRDVLDAYAEVMKWMLTRHPEKTFLLPNIGKFSIVDVPEKSGVAGFNGKEYCIPAHQELRFTFMDKAKYLEK